MKVRAIKQRRRLLLCRLVVFPDGKLSGCAGDFPHFSPEKMDFHFLPPN